MHYKFCPQCGEELEGKLAGDDGLVPFCKNCDQYWFDTFPTCVIVLVANEYNEVTLLRQSYMSDKYSSFVSGYMSMGETAEEAAIREVYEELGIELESIEYGGSYWFGEKGILMLGFIAFAKKCEMVLSSEVDSASWVPAAEALQYMWPPGPGNAAYGIYIKYMDSLKEKGFVSSSPF